MEGDERNEQHGQVEHRAVNDQVSWTVAMFGLGVVPVDFGEWDSRD
jgi:hypothetical protein